MDIKERRAIHGQLKLIPALFLLVMLVGPLFSQPDFHRTIYHDLNVFFDRYHTNPIYYDGEYSATGNDSMQAHSRYFPELDSAGFNLISAPGLNHPSYDWLGENWYEDLQLYVGTWRTRHYGYAQEKDYEIGTDPYEHYFQEICPTCVGEMYYDHVWDVEVFFCDYSTEDSGYVIDHDFPNDHQRWSECYYMEMRIKTDTAGTGSSDNEPFITIEFGIESGGTDGFDQYFSPNLLEFLEDNAVGPLDEDYAPMDTTLLVGDLVHDSQYHIISLEHYINPEGINPAFRPTMFKVYWHQRGDLYMDWIKVRDKQAIELWYAGSAIRDSVDALICEHLEYLEAQAVHDSLIVGMFIDEPFCANFRAVAAVDTLVDSVMGLDYVANLVPWGPYLYQDYYDLCDPPFLSIDPYPLKAWVLEESHSNDPTDTTLQEAWDLLIYDDNVVIYQTGDTLYQGYRPGVEFAIDNDISWMPYIQLHYWWTMYTNGSVLESVRHDLRDPTANEIFCQAYLALSFGAKGMQYFGISPMYKLVDDTLVTNPATEDSGFYYHSGMFNFRTAGNAVPTLNDFPQVFHTGYLVPNYKYYAVKDFHEELDHIDSVLLDMDWVESFCTDSIRHYDYIDSVWTVGDDHIVPPYSHRIDSTFVQVGVFDPQGSAFAVDKYMMLVNRRCLEDETRDIYFRLNFEAANDNRCLVVSEWRSFYSWFNRTDENGVMVDSILSMAPGHGTLINIHDAFPEKKVITSQSTVDWGSDSLIFVADTVEVEGTLRMLPGAHVKVCDCTDGIIVKPGGHLSIIGTADSMITIEGVADPVHGNIKLWGSGTDTIMYANIRNLNYGVALGDGRILVLKHCNISNCNTGVISVGEGYLYMDSCTVDSCNWEGIFLQSGDDGYIRHCDILHSGESGIRLHEVKSTFKVGYNTIEGNSTNQDSAFEAVRIYNCSPQIYGSYIEDNDQDGLGAYNDAYPVMNKDPDQKTDGLNRLIGNGDQTTNRHVFMSVSAPVLQDGHNDIYNSGNDTTALIVGEEVSVEGTYKLGGNYYGSWEEEPGWAFDLDVDYDWKPQDKNPNTQLFDEGDALEAFNIAMEHEIWERWGLAASAYLDVVRDYPESYFAQASLDRMLGCYQAVSASLPNLQLMFETICDTTGYEHLYRKARQMAIRCLVNRRQYDQAISRLEGILAAPSLTFTDSIYTVIDIASVHMRAYYDSLICSWDPSCDPPGFFSATPSHRGLNQPISGIDGQGSHFRKVDDNKRTHSQSSATNTRRTAEQPDASRDIGSEDRATTSRAPTQSLPTFTQAPGIGASMVSFGGTYVTEAATYPLVYRTELRPEDDEDYRLRVRDLLAQLRGIDDQQNANQAPPVPDNYFLAQNYPNPFNPITTISYGLPDPSHVKITIYNILGREVITLVNGDRPAGYHHSLWDSKSAQGIDVSSGLYFYRIEANNFVDVKKMVLLR